MALKLTTANAYDTKPVPELAKELLDKLYELNGNGLNKSEVV